MQNLPKSSYATGRGGGRRRDWDLTLRACVVGGLNIEGDSESWDFGVGAGFYVNATTEKWGKNYRMYDYVTRELPDLIFAELPLDRSRVSITGHSMGGHGALICALKNPGVYKVFGFFFFFGFLALVGCCRGKTLFFLFLVVGLRLLSNYESH